MFIEEITSSIVWVGMLNFFQISLLETRRDFASSRSAGEPIFTWVASEVELSREQCPGAADRVLHQVWGGVPVQEEGGSEGGVWHNGVARHWHCGSLCQLTTTVAPPEGSRLLRLAVGPRQPASSEDLFRSAAFRDCSWSTFPAFFGLLLGMLTYETCYRLI